jgi:hypothetical protein
MMTPARGKGYPCGRYMRGDSALTPNTKHIKPIQHMKINIVKESFGPFRIAASLEFDPKSKGENGQTNQDRYLSLGALYELERKPSSDAEKLFWTEKNEKGQLVRGQKFTRNGNIPATEAAARQIRESLEAAGYQDVTVEVREQKEAGGPAWKRNVAALVSMVGMDLETREGAGAKVKAMTEKLGLERAEVQAYFNACLAKI